MNKAARGFTIIELVVLITCIGILGAVAFPRFAMVEVEARKALVISLGGSISSAASQAHLLWQIQGKPATIAMEDQTITMLNGYPNEASIDNTLMDYSGFQYNNASVARFRHMSATAPNTCMVTYEDAVAPARPAVVVYSSGC